MTHPVYPPDTRFAVSFHKDHPEGIPDGWPKDMVELRPKFPAQLTSDGKTKLKEIPQEEISPELKAKGYVVMTGAEIMALRKALKTKDGQSAEEVKAAQEAAEEAERVRKGLQANQDVETMNRLSDGFEWPAGSGQKFSLSLAAQVNMNRYAARTAMRTARLALSEAAANTVGGKEPDKIPDLPPFVVSTFSHERLEVPESDFQSFFDAANAALYTALENGRVRKLRLVRDVPVAKA